jgi:hypothetical protein
VSIDVHILSPHAASAIIVVSPNNSISESSYSLKESFQESLVWTTVERVAKAFGVAPILWQMTDALAPLRARRQEEEKVPEGGAAAEMPMDYIMDDQ